MAIPTLSTVAPSAGLTRGGNVVELTGTGFRVPPAPPATGYLGGVAPQTVRVSFAGVASTWAHALSATKAVVRVPTWAGALATPMPLLVDVRLANVNDLGAEIATENVTKGNAYTYGLPALSPERRLQAATGALVATLRRHILPNVHVLTARDYDSTTGTVPRAPATLPAIHVSGPTCRLNRFDSVDYAPAEATSAGGHTWQRFARPVTMDLSYQVEGWAANPWHLHAMAGQFVLLFRQHPWLAITTDPSSPDAVTERHQIEVEWEAHPAFGAMVPGADDLVGWRAGVMVRAVHLSDEPGMIIEQGWNATTTTLNGQGL